MITGLAGVTALADVAGLLGRGSGGPPEDPTFWWHHANGDRGDWAGGGRDPNAGIRTLGSDLTLPAQFRASLPIPETLMPTRRDVDTDYYDVVQTPTTVEIIPGTKTPIWSYNGTFPGPTIVQDPGRRVVVTHRNSLPVPTVVHLHGGDSPHDSDGYPTDVLLPDPRYGPFPEMPAMAGMPAMSDPDALIAHGTRSYVYPPQPRAATLWYHDHRMDFTGPSVYRGLAGFYIARDRTEQALPLPKDAHDVPLMIADRAFNADGSFLYPALDPTQRTTPGVDEQSMNGVMGDVILVNGAPWPVMNVDTARYRFRILNASNARTYQLALHETAGDLGFIQIGTDHGLLAAPLPRASITISPAERYDVIIDFSRHRVGDQITLVNQLGTGSTSAVMRFLVTRTVADGSSVPATLAPTDTITPSDSVPRRTIKFHRGPGDWTINGEVFDTAVSQADVRAGSTELWTVISDFHHPFHIHNATIQVIARDGRPPGPADQGWKDTVFVNKGEKVQLALRFSSYTGRYVFHCHNLEHEDMGMMANFRIT